MTGLYKFIFATVVFVLLSGSVLLVVMGLRNSSMISSVLSDDGCLELFFSETRVDGEDVYQLQIKNVSGGTLEMPDEYEIRDFTSLAATEGGRSFFVDSSYFTIEYMMPWQEHSHQTEPLGHGDSIFVTWPTDKWRYPLQTGPRRLHARLNVREHDGYSESAWTGRVRSRAIDVMRTD